MTYAELSKKLDELDRPIPTLGLSRIENGARRVDADDLVALAIALGTTPNLLLLPPGGEDAPERVQLTPAKEMTLTRAWRWLNTILPLPDGEAMLDSKITLAESTQYDNELRPITEAIRAAFAAGVPVGKVHAWAEHIVMEEIVRRSDADLERAEQTERGGDG